MRRRHIAQMVISDGVGGAEAVVRQIARHLDQSRYDCLVITNDEIRGYFQEAGLRVASLGAVYGPRRLRRLNTVLEKFGCRHSPILARLHAARDRFAEILLQHQSELIHSNLIADHYLSSLLPLDAVPRVMTIHGGLGLDVEHPYLLGRDEVVAVTDQATFLTSACQYFLSLLTANGADLRDRSTIIENGIDPSLLARERRVTSDERRAASRILKMVFLGGDRPLKGGDLLAQALSLVVHDRRLTNVHLTVLRKVHRRSDLYQCIRAKGLGSFIDFVGYVAQDGHLDYIRASDLFVLPSRSEGIANTLMEAIGLGKAVLATDVGGTPEVLSHGVNGYLCRPAPDSLADGIEYFLRNPGRIAEFAHQNAERRGRFLWPALVKKYQDLYDRLLTGRCLANE